MRPLSWMVTAAALAVVLLGARAVSARRVRATAEPREAEPAPPRPPVFRPALPLPRVRPASALAHLRGRVIVPAGAKVDLDDLEVTADDGEHQYEAATGGGGRFELHLPARAYTVTASIDELVGVATAAVRPGADEPLSIRLQPAVAIEVDVAHSSGFNDDLQATVTRTGSSLEIASAEVEDGGLRIKGLLRGAVYDLTVANGSRKTTIRGITAPAVVPISLPPVVTLRGAIGFAAGTSCPFHSVSLVARDDNDTREENVDANCRFQVDGLDPGSEIHLRASGDGWHLDEHLTVPDQDDAEPVCLNPPCRDLPPVVPAKLEVILTGAPRGSGIQVSVGLHGEYSGCGGSGDRCEIGELAPDVAGTLSVRSRPCETVSQPVALHGGRNSVSVACHRMKLVEGIVRGRDTSKVGFVSCENGGRAALTDGSVFELRCPGGTREILYRGGPDVVRRAAVPDANPAFVELTL